MALAQLKAVDKNAYLAEQAKLSRLSGGPMSMLAAARGPHEIRALMFPVIVSYAKIPPEAERKLVAASEEEIARFSRLPSNEIIAEAAKLPNRDLKLAVLCSMLRQRRLTITEQRRITRFGSLILRPDAPGRLDLQFLLSLADIQHEREDLSGERQTMTMFAREAQSYCTCLSVRTGAIERDVCNPLTGREDCIDFLRQVAPIVAKSGIDIDVLAGLNPSLAARVMLRTMN